MARPRKTIKVAELITRINSQIEHVTYHSDSNLYECTEKQKLGMLQALCSVVETALHSTNSYSGFQWLSMKNPGRIAGYDEVNAEDSPFHAMGENTRWEYYARSYYPPKE